MGWLDSSFKLFGTWSTSHIATLALTYAMRVDGLPWVIISIHWDWETYAFGYNSLNYAMRVYGLPWILIQTVGSTQAFCHKCPKLFHRRHMGCLGLLTLVDSQLTNTPARPEWGTEQEAQMLESREHDKIIFRTIWKFMLHDNWFYINLVRHTILEEGNPLNIIIH